MTDLPVTFYQDLNSYGYVYIYCTHLTTDRTADDTAFNWVRMGKLAHSGYVFSQWAGRYCIPVKPLHPLLYL